MLRVTHQGTFHMGVKERGRVSAHILLSFVCGLWALAAAFLSQFWPQEVNLPFWLGGKEAL